MTNIEQIKEICDKKMQELNLVSKKYIKQCEQELKDLENYQEYKKLDISEKLLKQQGLNKNTNTSGSLICYLLNISSIDPIANNIRARKITLVAGDCPDIDTDFDPRYREWVKTHISEVFGKEKVCSIGSYVTYKTRAVIVDVARALGKDVHEIQDITKEMDPMGKYSTEDEEGNEEEAKLDNMSFEDLKKQFPRLKEYLDNNPDVERFAMILRNQVKNMGKHAGGVLISDLNLQEEIPVIRDKSGSIVSTWTEGMGGRELSSIGLVKYDILSLAGLSIVDGCVKFIEQTRGKKYARKDIPINDKESIFNSSMTDLVGIFQFENASTKEITDLVKMESLNDITAVTSLIRPGPRNMGMDRQYAINKNEGYVSNYPESISKHLEETHGILTYQEEIMLISQDFAGFSPIESNQLRSVLAKKKADKVPYYREKFIKGAMANADKHGMSEKEVSDFFSLIESFAEYGFNKCIGVNSLVSTICGEIEIKNIKIGEYVKAPCNTNGYKYVKVIDKMFNGEKDCFEILTEKGKKINCTLDHKFLCETYDVLPLKKILDNNYKLITENGFECFDIKHIGLTDTMDIEVDSEEHLFYANGIATSNSHALSYSALTACEFYLKHHYPVEYFAALLNVTAANKEKHGANIFVAYMNYCRKRGFNLFPPCINKSKQDFTLEKPSQYGGKWDIRFALNKIKQVGSASDCIVECQPYSSFEDFYERVNKRKVNKRIIDCLIAVDAFHEFGTKDEINKKYYELRKEDVPEFSKKDWKMKEKELLGICLSEPPLRIKYKDKMKQEWKFIGEGSKKGLFLGRIENIKEVVSKKSGNPLLIVDFSDDLDNISFFVFNNDISHFRSQFKKGFVIAMPLNSFPDSDTKFFNNKVQFEILERW